MKKIFIIMILYFVVIGIRILAIDLSKNYPGIGSLYKINSKSKETIEEFKKKLDQKLKIYKIEINSGETRDYAEYYSVLKVDRELDEDLARKQAKIYERQLKHKKSRIYADYYSILVAARKYNKKTAKDQAMFYEKLINSEERSEIYTDYYSSLIVCKHLDESTARKQALIFCELLEKEGRSLLYADYCTNLIIYKGLEEVVAKKQAEIYERTLETEGKFYSNYYAELVTYRIFKKGIIIGCEKDLTKEMVKNYIYNRMAGKEICDAYDNIMKVI